MSEQTKIEWCDHTWSPWEGCTKVSPGCLHCYAETRNRRYGMDNWGRGKPRRVTKDWEKPRRWNQRINYLQEIGRIPLRPRIFPSLCDPFDEEVPLRTRARFYNLMEETPNLDWLLLTKRPENVRSQWLPPNAWLGVSVEDQDRADERIPRLLRIEASLRFLSVEPLLGPVNLYPWIVPLPGYEEISWVIVGGESGPGARPCNVDWVRTIVGQCHQAGVPCFVKQLGSNPTFFDDGDGAGGTIYEFRLGPPDYPKITHPKGGDPSEWPMGLRVREFPQIHEGEPAR